MKNVLVLLAHPDIEKSFANRTIINSIKDHKNIQIRDLSSLYPDFNVDAAAEQQELIPADLIIFQYPLHWYNIPPVLKQWLDSVFTYGFAFGKKGDKLKGKDMLLSLTIGGAESSYSPEGHNRFNTDEMLIPMKQVANHIGMNYLNPVKSYEMEYLPKIRGNKKEVEYKALNHSKELLEIIDQYV